MHVVAGGQRENEETDVVVAVLGADIECVFEMLSTGEKDRQRQQVLVHNV